MTHCSCSVLDVVLGVEPWHRSVRTLIFYSKRNRRPERERACLKSHGSWVREPGLEPESVQSLVFTGIVWDPRFLKSLFSQERFSAFLHGFPFQCQNLSPYCIIKPGSSRKGPEEMITPLHIPQGASGRQGDSADSSTESLVHTQGRVDVSNCWMNGLAATLKFTSPLYFVKAHYRPWW